MVYWLAVSFRIRKYQDYDAGVLLALGVVVYALAVSENTQSSINKSIDSFDKLNYSRHRTIIYDNLVFLITINIYYFAAWLKKNLLLVLIWMTWCKWKLHFNWIRAIDLERVVMVVGSQNILSGVAKQVIISYFSMISSQVRPTAPMLFPFSWRSFSTMETKHRPSRHPANHNQSLAGLRISEPT